MEHMGTHVERCGPFTGAPAGIRRCSRVLPVLLTLLLPCIGIAQSRATVRQARQDFTAICAACHGLDGRGGEHAPNIATDPAVQGLSDRQLFGIVHEGIANRGMPSFASLGEARLHGLVAYLRTLSGKSKTVVPGDPAQGRAIFFGKGHCDTCHSIHGRGGFLGGDLTRLGQVRSPDEIRKEIMAPDATQGLITAVTRAGQRLTGVLRNEDNFSVQLLSTDGVFHLLLKSQIVSWQPSGVALMPGDYGRRLSAAELQDLVRYLSGGIAGKRSQEPGQ